MKSAIDKLRAQYAQNRDAADRRKLEIFEQEEALEELKKAQARAAKAGNQAEYDRLEDEIKQTERRIIVLVKSAPSAIVTPEDGVAAWREYAADYSKEQGKRWADYQKAQKAACDKYEECVKAENDFLMDRDSVATMCGYTFGSENDRQEIERAFTLPEILPGRDINKRIQDLPEMRYFTSAGLWDNVRAENTLNHVVRLGRPVGAPDFGHK